MDLTQKTPDLSILALEEWRASFTGYMIKFGILTAFFIGCFIAIFVSGSIRDVIENWSRFRCNPLIMPFSDFFGYDSSENFQFCVKSMMQNQSGEFFQPIYGLLGQFSSSLGLIINTINGFRKVLGNFRLSADNFIGSVKAKITALLLQVRLTFMRMQTLMGRVYGTMYSIIWMGTSAITAGTSLQDNSLVNFMFEFCFAPETRIQLADGSIKAIRDIQIGDILDGNIRVTSTFVFTGLQTHMVRIGADMISAEHRVRHEGAWIPAYKHPSAVPVDPISRLICLNVEGHTFRTAAGLEVADYDESESERAIAEAQRLASFHLNGGKVTEGVKDYSLGLDGEADVWMADKSWRPLHSLQIGDRVYGGATIQGLVKESCPSVYEWGGLLVSAAQLVYLDGGWVRVEHIKAAKAAKAATAPTHLLHILTDISAPLFIRNRALKAPIVVRDYREAAIPEMETPYLADLAEEK